MRINEHIDYINRLICFVFDNETYFMEVICKNKWGNYIDLAEFYVASDRCRYTVITDDGAHVTDTVKTAEVIGWYNESLK